MITRGLTSETAAEYLDRWFNKFNPVGTFKIQDEGFVVRVSDGKNTISVERDFDLDWLFEYEEAIVQ